MTDKASSRCCHQLSNQAMKARSASHSLACCQIRTPPMMTTSMKKVSTSATVRPRFADPGAFVPCIQAAPEQIDRHQTGQKPPRVLDGRLVEGAEDGWLVGDHPAAEELFVRQLSGPLEDAAEDRVDAEKGQQSERDEPGQTAVPVIGDQLGIGDQLPDPEVQANFNRSINDDGHQLRQEAEGAAMARFRPRVPLTCRDRQPLSELGAEPTGADRPSTAEAAGATTPDRCRAPGCGGRPRSPEAA